jgi:hypothetical protein
VEAMRAIYIEVEPGGVMYHPHYLTGDDKGF